MISRYLVALYSAAISSLWLLPEQASAQKNEVRPNRGDIIAYEGLGETRYGLIIELDLPNVMVEYVGQNGEIQSDSFVTFDYDKWQIIDRYQKQPAFAPRTWSSANGKFQIKAALQAIEGDKVRLTKDDGKAVTVAIADLSSADQEYLEKVGGNDSPAADNPFAAGESANLPEQVVQLIARREELLEIEATHQRLAKGNPTPAVGDIIYYHKFPKGTRYGLISGTSFAGPSIEFVTEDGTLDIDHSFNSSTRWRFFDRPGGSGELESRTWTSSGGKFKIDASLQGVAGDKVELKKSTGETVAVEITQLSRPDQDYVQRNRNRVSAAAAAEDVERRANYPADLQKLLARRGEILKLNVANRQSAADVAKIASIRLQTGPFSREAAQLRPLQAGHESFRVQVGLQDVAAHGRIQGVCYAAAAGHVAFVVGTPFEGGQALAVVDTKSGEQAATAKELGKDAHALAISPSGKTIVVFSQPGSGNQLELWRHEAGALQRISTVSYESFFTPSMTLFSDTRGAVMNSKGDLIFFDIDERIIPTHLVSGSADAATRPNRIFPSNNGQTLFFFSAVNNVFYGIDVESKKCIGGIALPAVTQPTTTVTAPIAEISPDGELLVVASGKSLTHLSLKTGQVVGQHDVSTANFAANKFDSPYSELQMLGPDLLLISNQNIFDLRLGVDIGSVKAVHGAEALQFADAARVCCEIDRSGGFDSGIGGFGAKDDDSGISQLSAAGVGDANRGDADEARGLSKNVSLGVAVSLQRLPVAEITAQARSLEEKDILVLGQGDRVKLTIDLGRGEQQIESRIRAKVESDLAAGGVKLADQSDFTLHLKYVVGEPQTQKYRIFGNGAPYNRTVTVTPKSCTATLRYRDEVIWNASSAGGLGRPFDVETLDRNIQHANSVSPQDFLNMKYPSSLRLLRPSKRLSVSWQ